MIAIDTNVLLRALTDDLDSKAQSTLSTKLIQAAGTVFISQVVQVEFFWVLDRAYKLPKTSLTQALQTLLVDDSYYLQKEHVFRDALVRYQEGNTGFADALIAVESQLEGAELWTFDRKLGNQEGVVKLTGESLANFQST